MRKGVKLYQYVIISINNDRGRRRRRRPPHPKRPFHLVLCVVIHSLRDIRVFPSRIRPFRGGPRLCLCYVPHLLAQPRHEFMATHTRYRGRFLRSDLPDVLCVPIHEPRTNLHSIDMYLSHGLQIRLLFMDMRSRLAGNLRTCVHPYHG
jgi:hypothetical protein